MAAINPDSCDAPAERRAIEGMRDERLFIFPHPRVGEYYAKKAARTDRWLDAMAGLQEKFTDAARC